MSLRYSEQTYAPSPHRRREYTSKAVDKPC